MENNNCRWVKAGDEVPTEPDMKQWRIAETHQPVLWHQIKRRAVSEDHSDELEWLSESPIEPCGCEELKVDIENWRTHCNYFIQTDNAKAKRISELEKELQRIYEKHGYDSIKQLLNKHP